MHNKEGKHNAEEQHQILIIEDEDSQRRVLEYNLQQEGYKVYTVSSAEEGLEFFKNILNLAEVVSLLCYTPPFLTWHTICST